MDKELKYPKNIMQKTYQISKTIHVSFIYKPHNIVYKHCLIIILWIYMIFYLQARHQDKNQKTEHDWYHIPPGNQRLTIKKIKWPSWWKFLS